MYVRMYVCAFIYVCMRLRWYMSERLCVYVCVEGMGNEWECVCICVCMYICVCNVCIYKCLCLCIYVFMRLCLYVSNVYVIVYKYVCLYAFMRLCLYVIMCVCVWGRECVCMCVFMLWSKSMSTCVFRTLHLLYIRMYISCDIIPYLRKHLIIFLTFPLSSLNATLQGIWATNGDIVISQYSRVWDLMG